MTAESTPSSERSEPEAAVIPPRTSPGTLIRQARERVRLTIDELAAQSKLARGTLEALEADAFGGALEPVYIRGYYRKCAKILNLSENELIAAYEALAAPASPRMPAKIRLSTSGAGEGAGPAGRLLVLLLLGLLIGLAAFLWMQRSPMPLDAEGSRVDASTQPVLVASPTPQPLPSPVVTAADVAPPATVEAVVPSPTAAAPAPAAVSAPISGELRVSLRITETSWVRINDAEGRALVNGLLEAGQTQELRGAGPLSVFLGNAPGVSLRFEDQPVDLRPLTNNNNTARFTLPLGR